MIWLLSLILTFAQAAPQVDSITPEQERTIYIDSIKYFLEGCKPNGQNIYSRFSDSLLVYESHLMAPLERACDRLYYNQTLDEQMMSNLIAAFAKRRRDSESRSRTVYNELRYAHDAYAQRKQLADVKLVYLTSPLREKLGAKLYESMQKVLDGNFDLDCERGSDCPITEVKENLVGALYETENPAAAQYFRRADSSVSYRLARKAFLQQFFEFDKWKSMPTADLLKERKLHLGRIAPICGFNFSAIAFFGVIESLPLVSIPFKLDDEGFHENAVVPSMAGGLVTTIFETTTDAIVIAVNTVRYPFAHYESGDSIEITPKKWFGWARNSYTHTRIKSDRIYSLKSECGRNLAQSAITTEELRARWNKMTDEEKKSWWRSFPSEITAEKTDLEFLYSTP